MNITSIASAYIMSAYIIIIRPISRFRRGVDPDPQIVCLRNRCPKKEIIISASNTKQIWMVWWNEVFVFLYYHFRFIITGNYVRRDLSCLQWMQISREILSKPRTRKSGQFSVTQPTGTDRVYLSLVYSSFKCLKWEFSTEYSVPL